MAKLLSVILVLIGCTLGEPPVNHKYQWSPTSKWNSYGAFSGGGSYTPVPVGPQTSEGYHVDPHLVEKIKHILLKDEINNGPQEYNEEEKIIGIEIIDIKQSIELAQYHQSEGDSGTDSYGSHNNHGDFSDGHSKYYSDPSQSYQPPSSGLYDGSDKSSSYDVPIESSYESVPHSAPESDHSSYSSVPSTGSHDQHNSYNTPASVYGPSTSQSHGPSSYEKRHSINARNVRRTSPFYSVPYRPIFYNFRN